jgi:cytoskeletal protein RodZ
MTVNAFGSNLRRIRLQRGITLARIARSTRIAEDRLEGLERNDFSGWPSGIYARAYVRQYASAIGVEGDQTVYEFCRNFPQGDRRAAPLFRELSAHVGHRLAWRDEDEHQRRATDRRRRERRPRPNAAMFFSRLRRLLLAPR